MLIGLAVLAVAFFILPTRVHERYLYPFVALGAILGAASLRWRIAYLILSATTFLNMYVVLTTLYPDNPGSRTGWGSATALRGKEGVTVDRPRRRGRRGLGVRPAPARRAVDAFEDEIDESAADDRDEEELDDGVVPAGAPGRPAGPATLGAAATAAFASGGGAPADRDRRRWHRGGRRGRRGGDLADRRRGACPTWNESPSFTELGPIGWFRAKLAERPVRPDRSKELDHEPRRARSTGSTSGSSSCSSSRSSASGCSGSRSRTRCTSTRSTTRGRRWSSSRTGATGSSTTSTNGPIPTSRSTRWPAASSPGATTRSPRRADLGVPVVDAAIEPRRDDPALGGDTGGDRVDVATGSEVRSYDLSTRKLIATIPLPGARAIAMDEDGLRLVVGSGRRLDLDDRRDGARHGQRRRQRRASAARVARQGRRRGPPGLRPVGRRRGAGRDERRPGDHPRRDHRPGSRHRPAQGGGRPRARRHGSGRQRAARTRSPIRRPRPRPSPRSSVATRRRTRTGCGAAATSRWSPGSHRGPADEGRERDQDGSARGPDGRRRAARGGRRREGRRADRSHDRRARLDGRRRRRPPTAWPSRRSTTPSSTSRRTPSRRPARRDGSRSSRSAATSRRTAPSTRPRWPCPAR